MFSAPGYFPYQPSTHFLCSLQRTERRRKDCPVTVYVLHLTQAAQRHFPQIGTQQYYSIPKEHMQKAWLIAKGERSLTASINRPLNLPSFRKLKHLGSIVLLGHTYISPLQYTFIHSCAQKILLSFSCHWD